MSKFTATVEIHAPAEQVWEVLADFGNTYLYNPTVTRSHLTSETGAGVGTSRHCDFTLPGASVEERIIDWHDGHSYSLEVYDGSRIPFRTAEATFTITAVDAGTTRVTADFSYRVKFGVLGTVLDRAAVRSQNEKAIAGLLAGLKHYVETTERVMEGVRVDRTAVTVG